MKIESRGLSDFIGGLRYRAERLVSWLEDLQCRVTPCETGTMSEAERHLRGAFLREVAARSPYVDLLKSGTFEPAQK